MALALREKLVECSLSMSHKVFVSYSHHDAALIAHYVKLMRSTNDWVFLDSDSIQTGKKWRAEIDAALLRATLLVVFWCRHSQSSAEVRREYRTAVRTRKEVIPVLLDSTAPPRALAQFQWLDFRDFVRGKHDDGAAGERSGEHSQRGTTMHANAWAFIGIAAASWLAWLGSWFSWLGLPPVSDRTWLLWSAVVTVGVIWLGINSWLGSRRMKRLDLLRGDTALLRAMIRRRLALTQSAT
jgi:hypothetical protein